ncbi:hypothetical protein A1QI_16360 [Vibrio genomosp. F10 str. 9ZB36]|nr:hypothetical protein A1QI_16360 [Vibrio genomosp. F10 str. 9ZB36]
MNHLLKNLLERGIKAKLRDDTIYINLSFFTFPILVIHNIQLNCYELKVQYWRYILISLSFLMYLLLDLGSAYRILFCTLAIAFLLLALLAHHKSNEIKNYIESINSVESA